MIKKPSSSKNRANKHYRLRKDLNGTADRPRLSVYRSNLHMYAQLIDDVPVSYTHLDVYKRQVFGLRSGLAAESSSRRNRETILRKSTRRFAGSR